MLSKQMYSDMSADISKALRTKYEAEYTESGTAGGGGANIGIVKDVSGGGGMELFVKYSNLAGFDMLNAEYLGIKEFYDSGENGLSHRFRF